LVLLRSEVSLSNSSTSTIDYCIHAGVNSTVWRGSMTRNLDAADKPQDACARRLCAAKSCSLVNDSDLLAGFCDFHLPFSHLALSVSRNPSRYRVHIWSGKTRMAGLQSGKGRMMIDSVVWAQYINVTDTHTDSHVAIANAPAPTHCVRLKSTTVRPSE